MFAHTVTRKLSVLLCVSCTISAGFQAKFGDKLSSVLDTYRKPVQLREPRSQFSWRKSFS
jgi:hypothetical protein